jgi:hypothetical protein
MARQAQLGDLAMLVRAHCEKHKLTQRIGHVAVVEAVSSFSVEFCGACGSPVHATFVGWNKDVVPRSWLIPFDPNLRQEIEAEQIKELVTVAR